MFNTAFSGQYRLEVRRNGQLVQEAEFDNLITDYGLNLFGGTSSIVQYARVGTGTSTPTATQTALDTQIASASTGSFASSATNEGVAPYRTTQTWTATFAQGAVVGNITEIGVGTAATGNNLFSRALIVDGNGNPTSITLTSIDQLTVYYTVRVTPPTSDVTGALVLNGTTYNYTMRICNAASFMTNNNNFNGYFFSGYGSSAINTYPAGSNLGAVTAAGPSGSTSGTAGSSSTAAYTTGTYYRDTTFSLTPAQGNATGGIQCMRLILDQNYSNHQYQVRFDTPIPKTNTQSFSITLRTSWGR